MHTREHPAAQLISNMTGKWKPADYTEHFSAAVHELTTRKVKAGETESLALVEDLSKEKRSSNVIDLTELLATSLKRKTDTAGKGIAVCQADGRSAFEESRKVAGWQAGLIGTAGVAATT